MPDPGAGVPNVGLEPLLLREDPRACDSHLLFWLPTRGVGPSEITSLPFLPVTVWVFLYTLGCRKAVLLVLRLFSERVFLYVFVVLVYL